MKAIQNGPSRLCVTQLSNRIRLMVGLSAGAAGSGRKWWRCGSSRLLPPSWELQEELRLSAGDLPLLEQGWGPEEARARLR